MKGYRPKITPDPAVSQKLYARLRSLTHDRTDIVRVANGPFLMSREIFEKLNKQISSHPGPAFGAFGGIEILVVGNLPMYTKRHRPSVERFIAKKRAVEVLKKHGEWPIAVRPFSSAFERLVMP